MGIYANMQNVREIIDPSGPQMSLKTHIKHGKNVSLSIRHVSL